MEAPQKATDTKSHFKAGKTRIIAMVYKDADDSISLERGSGEQFLDSGQTAFQFGNARVLRFEFFFELGVQALDGR